MQKAVTMMRGTRLYFRALMFCHTMEDPAVLTELEIRLVMLLSLLAMPAMADTSAPYAALCRRISRRCRCVRV